MVLFWWHHTANSIDQQSGELDEQMDKHTEQGVEPLHKWIISLGTCSWDKWIARITILVTLSCYNVMMQLMAILVNFVIWTIYFSSS